MQIRSPAIENLHFLDTMKLLQFQKLVSELIFTDLDDFVEFYAHSAYQSLADSDLFKGFDRN